MKCDWKEVCLGDITKWSSGGTPSKSNPLYWGGTIPWISAKNMPDGWLDDAEPKITELGLDNGSKLAPQNSILMLVRGSGLYNRRYICITRQEVAFNQDVKCIETTDECLPEFLYYWLRGNDTNLFSLLETTGIGAGKFDTKRLQQMCVMLPPLEEQKKIVSLFRSFDDKIELNNKINENLLEQMKLLYQGLLTDCDCPLIRLGDIAQKIAMGPFGSNIKVSTFVSEGVPIISGNHLRSVFLEEPSYNFITEEHAQKLKNSIVYPRDIIFTHAGNIGQVAMIPNGCDYPYYMISQRQFYMRCDESKIIPELVLFFFHSREGKGKLLANANSTGVPSIAQPSTHLKNIEMPLPNKKDQDIWYKVIRPMVDEYVALCQENKRISALRDSLLPKLMNGEIDVNGI